MDNKENDHMFIELYEWVDSIPLSRVKKNISRDFSDAVLLAEIIKHYIPSIVEMHNYPTCHNRNLKVSNWNTLNSKVLKKIGIRLNKSDIEDIINLKPMIIENLLMKVKSNLEKYSTTLNNNPSENVSNLSGLNIVYNKSVNLFLI